LSISAHGAQHTLVNRLFEEVKNRALDGEFTETVVTPPRSIIWKTA